MFGKKNADMKAQSAMEYLMTYGWAILIIAVVLAALFELGVFNGSNLAPQACIAQAGFVCKNPVYTANGIGITFGQTAGRDYYGDWIFVASQGEALNQNGIPINFTCAATGCANAVPVGVLVPGQIVGVDFNASKFAYGQIPASAPIGTPFAGYVWLGYCFSPCSAPTAYSKVATITAKEAGTSSASFGGYFGGGSGSATSQPSGPKTGNVIFVANSLPAGTAWSVTYNGMPESANTPSNIVFTGIPIDVSLPYTIDVPVLTSSACYSTDSISGNAISGQTVPVQFSQVPCYVNITIDSTGGSAPTGFQQMLQFNPSSYYNYEASDLGNLRFYQGSTELYSWCESGCTSGSTSAIFWVKTNGLSSGTNANAITMDFEPLSGTMAQYSGPSGHAGEAPQISGQPSYGYYDNGANVFNNYWNFAGTTLPSGLSVVTQQAGGTYQVDNKLFTDGGTPDGAGITISTPSIVAPYGLLILNLTENYNTTYGCHANQVYIASSNSNNPSILTIGDTNYVPTLYALSNSFEGSIIFEGPLVSYTVNLEYMIGTSSQSGVITILSQTGNNPSLSSQETISGSYPISSNPIYLGDAGNWCSGGRGPSMNNMNVLAIFTYPPGRVMPNYSFGSSVQ